ncbi:helix-turn-helix domain-containing protein [Fructobacillus sp. M1-13]|uniref:Helix-turn-helix transcriptional regulator n=1 Tax=Fructobacillus papyriferae TaxID=2713171 RepID=A0ABS5QRF3_9LACO|nr:helix-turn-helix transcriptional regulator [Fructobacillus papyriferae]MBS9334981.1 helix-turn-helix transcriptional regulator [Fructobacillus papyriferae]MCD2159535.1 helix-turn-helix domain-containing protein [Fructobacillus papyriferae]
MTLFENIKEISKKRGINLKTVAKESGLGENAIYRWKTETPRIDSLKKVANTLNVDVKELLGDDAIDHTRIEDSFDNIQIAGMFRKYTEDNHLSSDEKEKLVDDISDYMKFRAERIAKERE